MSHGDLKGVCISRSVLSSILPNSPAKANILIDQAGHARIADFGLLTIVSDPTNVSLSSSYTQGGTARWMGPELIDPQRFGFKNGRPTKSSDCYALGMVIYETISGHLPFHEYADLTVFLKVLKGVRPPREVGFANSLWGMLESCWAPQPSARPSVEDVLQCLESVSWSSEPYSLEIATEGAPVWFSDLDSTSGSGMCFHLVPSATFRGLSSPVLPFISTSNQAVTKPPPCRWLPGHLRLLHPRVYLPLATLHSKRVSQTRASL